MEETPFESYFENIQLIKLVSSAEALLQQLYKVVSYEDQQVIDQWLCLKREFDHCLSTKSNADFDNSEDSVEDNVVRKHVQKSYSFDEYSEASIEEISSEREENSSDDDCDPNLFSSGFESECHNDMNAFKRNFQTTESLFGGWFNNLNLDSENSCGDHISNPYLYPAALRPFAYHPNYRVNLSNNAFMPYNDIPGFRFCHCCISGAANCRLILSLPTEEQIAYLREVKAPLIESCHKITSNTKRCDFESRTNKDLVMLHEVLELIDTTIEMKNTDYLAEFELEKFKENNFLVYSSLFDCFKMLSSCEMRYLFVCFLNKVTTLRESSSNLDKLILQLDNTIVDKEIRLRYLNKSYVKLRDLCSSLINKSKQSNQEPVTDDLEAIINSNENESFPETGTKDRGVYSPSSSTIPTRNIKLLHRSGSSKNFDITREDKNRLLIQKKDKNS